MLPVLTASWDDVLLAKVLAENSRLKAKDSVGVEVSYIGVLPGGLPGSAVVLLSSQKIFDHVCRTKPMIQSDGHLGS